MPFRMPTSPLFNCQSTRRNRSSTTLHWVLNSQLLRQRGVVVIGSGNVVHNLRSVDWGQPDGGFDWSHRFDDAARAHLTSSPSDLVALRDHQDFGAAVPTPDHFIPLLYIAGLASAAGSTAEVLVDGYTYGSLSMTSYTVRRQLACVGALASRCSRASRSRSDPSRRHQRLIRPIFTR